MQFTLVFFICLGSASMYHFHLTILVTWRIRQSLAHAGWAWAWAWALGAHSQCRPRNSGEQDVVPAQRRSRSPLQNSRALTCSSPTGPGSHAARGGTPLPGYSGTLRSAGKCAPGSHSPLLTWSLPPNQQPSEPPRKWLRAVFLKPRRPAAPGGSGTPSSRPAGHWPRAQGPPEGAWPADRE